jgi:hypothetical protein
METTIDTIFSPVGPARLYALLLRLRPLQAGTLMPFNGELVHGAFLRWLDVAAPDVAAWLHEGQKRRLFTCSSLHFAHPMQPQLRAEREHIHLPLDPQRTYTIRITLLLGDLFPLLHKALIQFSTSQAGTTPPFIQLGKQLFLLEEVLLGEHDPTGWTGFTSPHALVEKAAQIKCGKTTALTLEFASLTTFNRGNSKIPYGTHQAMLPLPLYVFQNLMKRWEDIAPPDLANVIQQEALDHYLQDDGVVIIDYDLKAHHVHFTTHQQRGFVGTCTYQLRSSASQVSTEAPLTLQQQVLLLAHLAFYSGVGYKTAMGLGQTRLRIER